MRATLEIFEGDIFGPIGKSGAGKSTLLRLINLLERPERGSVTVAGHELTRLGARALRAARQQIGMIFQQFNLLQNAPSYANLVAVRTADKDKQFARDIAAAYRSREFLEVTNRLFADYARTDYQIALQGGAGR